MIDFTKMVFMTFHFGTFTPGSLSVEVINGVAFLAIGYLMKTMSAQERHALHFKQSETRTRPSVLRLEHRLDKSVTRPFEVQ